MALLASVTASVKRHLAGMLNIIACRALLGLLGFLLACHAPPALAPSDLDALGAARDDGQLVYRGTVYPPGADQAAFVYARHVGSQGEDVISSHVTFRPDGEPVVLHRAHHTHDYALLRFEAIERQAGVSGTVTIEGERAVLSKRSGTRKIVRRERVTEPVVVGPTLFGMILRRWDELSRDQPVTVRFAVLARARTYGFTLRRIHADAAHTVIQLRADRPLVRVSVPSMTITFETQTRKVVRYEGRVPPLHETDQGLRPLDARVEYEFVADEYQ